MVSLVRLGAHCQIKRPVGGSPDVWCMRAEWVLVPDLRTPFPDFFLNQKALFELRLRLIRKNLTIRANLRTLSAPVELLSLIMRMPGSERTVQLQWRGTPACLYNNFKMSEIA